MANRESLIILGHLFIKSARERERESERDRERDRERETEKREIEREPSCHKTVKIFNLFLMLIVQNRALKQLGHFYIIYMLNHYL